MTTASDGSSRTAVEVHVETVDEDDDDGSFEEDDVDDDDFDDEMVVVAPAPRPPVMNSEPSSSSSSVLPDPEEWTNVVNTASSAFITAASSTTPLSSSLPHPDDDDPNSTFAVNATGHGASLPHTEEVKVEKRTSSSGSTTKKDDEPNHKTPLVMNTTGANSLPHPDEDPNALAVNSTGHGASLPHADEAKVEKKKDKKKKAKAKDEPDHKAPLLASTTEGVSLPHPDDDPNALAVNSTGHGASLPHADELKVDKKSGKNKNQKKGKGKVDGPDHKEPLRANTTEGVSLPHPNEDPNALAVNATGHGASLPHADEIKVDKKSGKNKNQKKGKGKHKEDEPDHKTPLVANTMGATSLPHPDDDDDGMNAFAVNATGHGASLPHADEIKVQQSLAKLNKNDESLVSFMDEPSLMSSLTGATSLPHPNDVDSSHYLAVNSSTSHGTSLPHSEGSNQVTAMEKRGSERSRRPSIGTDGPTMANRVGVSSLPQPGEDEGATFKVNATDHGASLPHADEVMKTKTKTIGGGLTLMDYDSDIDPDEKAQMNRNDDDDDDDEPDHDTPHAVQSAEHGASLPHPEEVRTSGVGGFGTNKDTGDEEDDEDETIHSQDDEEVFAAVGTGKNKKRKNKKENGKTKKANGKNGKKKKKAKRSAAMAGSVLSTAKDGETEGDRFEDEPGNNDDYDSSSSSDDLESGNLVRSRALVLVEKDSQGRSLPPPDGVFKKGSVAASNKKKPSIRSSLQARSRSLVESVRGMSSRLRLSSSSYGERDADPLYDDVIDGELVAARGGLGFTSAHTHTHRMDEDDEDDDGYGLSLDEGIEDDDDSMYVDSGKKHYRRTMLMTRGNLCIALAVLLFLALVIPLSIKTRDLRQSQQTTQSSSKDVVEGVGDIVSFKPTIPPTSPPTVAPTLPPVAANCVDSIEIAEEMANRTCFSPDEGINVTFTQCFPHPDDWIGLFPSNALFFGRLWRDYFDWIWTCGPEQCTEEQVTEDLPLRGKFTTPRLDPGNYQLFLVLDSAWPYRYLTSTEPLRVRQSCQEDESSAITTPTEAPSLVGDDASPVVAPTPEGALSPVSPGASPTMVDEGDSVLDGIRQLRRGVP